VFLVFHPTQKNRIRTLNPAILPKPRNYRNSNEDYVKPDPPPENTPWITPKFSTSFTKNNGLSQKRETCAAYFLFDKLL
jgi:hypothetical protein